MTADALKKITTDALDTLAALLDEGHSDQLTALLKTRWIISGFGSRERVGCPVRRERPSGRRIPRERR